MKIENYSFKYAIGKEYALIDVKLSIESGDIVTIFGESGSGKSTLLKCIKKEVRPSGEESGSIITEISSDEMAIVYQDVNNQLISTTVIDDLVFQMENLGYESWDMKKRLAETVSYFGLENLLYKNPKELSGGQKQILILCGALVIRPKILLLDEPTSQLDPIATREFFSILNRINEDFCITVIIVEHRLEEITNYSDKMILMKKGTVIDCGDTRSVLKELIEKENDEIVSVPSIPRFANKVGIEEILLRPKELQKEIQKRNIDIKSKKAEIEEIIGNKIVSLKRIYYRYDKEDFVLKNLFLNIYRGEKICLLGGNGSGKTTMLKLIGKIIAPSFGDIKKSKINVGYLPQNINKYFSFDTVLGELNFSFGKDKVDSNLVRQFGLKNKLDSHPYDLSGGEKTKLALISLIGKNTDLILLDEPTQGLDSKSKEDVIELLLRTKKTIICATHDMDFTIKFGNRALMLFDGEIAFEGKPRNILKDNQYYTTRLHKGVKESNSDIFILEDLCYE